MTPLPCALRRLLAKGGFVLASSLLLAGCLSLGKTEVPDTLLSLEAEQRASAGALDGEARRAVRVHRPETSAALDVERVPVRVASGQIAYLKGAQWVEKPAGLLRRLLAERLRATGKVLAIDSDDPALRAESHLRSDLRRFGYDAERSAVVVELDAVYQDASGALHARRFEAVEEAVAPRARPVGAALNRAANRVADEVSAWLLAL